MGKKEAKGGALTRMVSAEVETASPVWKFGLLFNKAAAELSVDETITAWALVGLLEDLSEERQKELREHLLETVQKRGVETDKGHFKLEVEGTEVCREKRQAKLPGDEDLKALMDKLSIPRDQVFDRVESYVLNPSKLDFLIDSGRIPKEEIEKLKKVSWALKVKLSDEIHGALEAARTSVGRIKPPKAVKALK